LFIAEIFLISSKEDLRLFNSEFISFFLLKFVIIQVCVLIIILLFDVEVEKLILQNRELGMTQIVVTHDLQFAENIADTILKVQPK